MAPLIADFVPEIGPGDFRKDMENASAAAAARPGQYEVPRTSMTSNSSPQGYTTTQVYDPQHTSSQGYAPNQAYSPPDDSVESNLGRLLHSPQQNDYQYPLHAQLQAAAQEASIAADSNSGQMIHSLPAMDRIPEHKEKKRLVRACDACSRRKVKCGEEFPCRNCVDLGMECTFERALKRRGPPNRVAQEIKRQKVDGSDDLVPVSSVPPSGASIHLIAHSDAVHQMIYEFFTHVYPIFPFPHENLALTQLEQRKDLEDKAFLVLITSMVAVLATLMPRAARRAMQNDHPEAIDALIMRCTQICLKFRGPMRPGRDANEAATSFFLGIVALHRPGSITDFEDYMQDSLSIVRRSALGDQGVDHVTSQLCKRIFWAIYNITHSMRQRVICEDPLPFLLKSQLPALPLPTDDCYIYFDQIQSQPEGQLSLIEGFDVVTQVYSGYHDLVILDHDLKVHPDDLDSRKQSTTLQALFAHLDNVLKTTHVDLVCSLAPGYFSMDFDKQNASAQGIRQRMRWEIQKVDIRAALLSTRFYFTERLVKNVGMQDELLKAEWTKIFKELKELLRQSSRESLEPVHYIVAPKLEPIFASFRDGHLSSVVEAEERDFILRKANELFGSHA
jgi:Fungal Zn(2)-Cys(6) binuclear cluster domain